jgi:hypothetical protein
MEVLKSVKMKTQQSPGIKWYECVGCSLFIEKYKKFVTQIIHGKDD